MTACLRTFAAVLLIASLARAVAAVPVDDAEKVGALGDLAKLIISGVPNNQANSVRDALIDDPFIQRAASPSAPLHPFLDQLTLATREAYLQAGYKEAQVTIDHAGEALTLHISSGPSYAAAKIRVDAPAEVDAAALAAALTGAEPVSAQSVTFDGDNITIALKAMQPNDSMNANADKPADPLWTSGEPARFDARFRTIVQDALACAIREQGFSKGSADFTYEINALSHSAAMRVSVSGLGPKMTLAQLDIGGTSANTPAIVRKFLGLADGQALNLHTLESIFNMLYKSGRFARQTLILTPLTKGRAALTIDLEEVPDVPTLDTPLSDADKALLRLGDWFENFARQPDDLEISGKFPIGAIRILINPTEGSLADIKLNLDQPGAMLDASIAASRRGFGMRTGGELYYFAPAQSPLSAVMTLVLEPHNFFIGSGVNTRQNENPSSPLSLHSRLMPAGLLSIAHAKGVACTVKDNVLTVAGANAHLTADAATGRLLEFASNTAEKGPLSYRATMMHGAFSAAFEKFRNDPGTNLHNPQLPFASGLRFLASATLRSPLARADATPDQRAAAAAIVDKLFTPDLMGSIDAWCAWMQKDNDFSIPLSAAKTARLAEPGNALGIFAPFVIPLYSYGSWPRTLIREVMLPDDPAASAAEFSRLYDDPALGPLACLAIAETIDTAKPAVATAFAQHGRQRLNAAALTDDMASLILTDAPAPRFTRQLLTNLQSLTPADAKTLAAGLPKDAGDLLLVLHAALQLHKGEPLEKSLPDGVKAFFPFVRPYLEGRLNYYLPPDSAGPPDLFISPPGK